MSKRKSTGSSVDPADKELQELDDLLAQEQAQLEGQLKKAQDDQEAALTDVQRGFRKRAKAEKKRFEQTTDSEYWCTLNFQTREQKEVFLEKMRWVAFLGPDQDKYLDGLAIAEFEGITLPDSEVKFVEAKPDKRLDEISLPLGKK